MAITRRFQLEVVKDRVLTEVVYQHVTDPDTGERRREQVTRERVVPEGYMVYFAGGQSIFVENREQLARLKLLPHLNADIDTETGEVVQGNDLRDLKATVMRKTAQTNGSLPQG